MAEAARRLRETTDRLSAAAKRDGRDASSVTLVAVTKTFPAEIIEPVLAAGHRDFGENRVQEAQTKWPKMRERYSGLRLHLIGPLQTNKVRDAVALFDVIHTVDRDKVAAALAKETARQGRTPSFFVQVNTGDEPQKAGAAPSSAAEFVRRCQSVHGLSVEGLMCIPPESDDPIPHFEMLRRLAEMLELRSLSMGMSGDFETAIAHGATHVRIGSAIFGERS